MSPAFIQRAQAGLMVVFHRQGQEVESLSARDGREAWEHAVRLIARRPFLEGGDKLLVLDAAGDDPPADRLPEASRASHSSP
jgi:hypothetical protein